MGARLQGRRALRTWRGDRHRHVLLGVAVMLLLHAACAYKVVEDGRINRAAVARLVSTVAEIRGLEPTRPLRVALESPAVLAQRARRDAADPQRRAVLARRRAVWAKLGLIDGTVDLNDAYSRITAEAPFGYYDTDDQVLRIVSRTMMRSEIFETISALRGRDVVAGEILSHEVCHALQDMRYDLDRLEKQAPSDDARLALRGLVEGDASLVGFLYSATFFQDFEDWVNFLNKRVARAMAIEGVPAYLNARAMFPYLGGGIFVARLYKSGGFAAIDSAYAAPPPSTEILLHPELHQTTAGIPRDVALPPLEEMEAEGASALAEDVLGEHGLRYVIARNTRRVDAAAATAGWGGDRYRVSRGADGSIGLVWATRWDSDADAAQFCEAYRALLAQSYVGTRAIQVGQTVRYRLDERTLAAIDCVGDAVDIVETVAPERIEAILARLIEARDASGSASQPASQEATSTTQPGEGTP